jgi:hypothetical protein
MAKEVLDKNAGALAVFPYGNFGGGSAYSDRAAARTIFSECLPSRVWVFSGSHSIRLERR